VIKTHQNVGVALFGELTEYGVQHCRAEFGGASSGFDGFRQSNWLGIGHASILSVRRVLLTTDYGRDVSETWLSTYIQVTRFDEQIAQAEMVTDETLAPQTAAAVIERIQVQDLTEQELEKLPFGAIQLDTAGRILPFNGFESQISGVSKEQAVGKLFFTEIAPCTNIKESCGRLKKV